MEERQHELCDCDLRDYNDDNEDIVINWKTRQDKTK